jgi:predicted PurR-regulated permease PerM
MRERQRLLPPLWVLSCLTAALLVLIALQLKELVVLMVLGYFLAYAIDPIVSAAQRRGFSRMVAVLAVFAVVVGAAFLLAFTTAPTVLDEFRRLRDNLNHYLEVGRDRLQPLLERIREYLPESLRNSHDVNEVLGALPALLSGVSGDTLKGVGRAVLGTVLQGYSLTLTFVNAALLPFIVYYVAVDLPHIHRFFVGLFPITKRVKVQGICSEIDGYVSAFVRGQVLVCSVLFILYAIGLGLVGVDLWLLLAAISGFGNLVPYLGFTAGILLSSLMALVTFGDLNHVLYVWGVFAVVQALEGTLITPKIIGDSVGLSPLVIIIALFAGGQLGGLLGLFLAVPAAAVMRVVIRHSYQWVLEAATSHQGQ